MRIAFAFYFYRREESKSVTVLDILPKSTRSVPSEHICAI